MGVPLALPNWNVKESSSVRLATQDRKILKVNGHYSASILGQGKCCYRIHAQVTYQHINFQPGSLPSSLSVPIHPL